MIAIATTDETASARAHLRARRRSRGRAASPRHVWGKRLPLRKVVSRATLTGHDHVDSVGLIHMNGRAYDPELGRFTGVDPFVTKPLNAQSLNPYSYVSNNPIMGTDPTGYREEAAFGAGLALAQHLSNGRFDGQAVVDAEIAAGTPGAQAISGGFEGAQSVLVSVSEIRSASAEGLAVGAIVAKVAEKIAEKIGDKKGRNNNGKRDQQSTKQDKPESTEKTESKPAENSPKNEKADFIVSKDGAVVHNSPEKVRESLEGAGFKGEPITNKSGTET